MVSHAREPCCVAVNGQAFPRVVEVSGVEGVAHRESSDDLCGKLLRIGLPLLGGVSADECLVQWAPDQ